MDPDTTWLAITSPTTSPGDRRDAALALLVWMAHDGHKPLDVPFQSIIDTCEAVIIAEFEYADRLAGR